MKMKNDAKFEEDLACQFKIDWKNLTNFKLSTQKTQKFTLMGLLLTKYIMFEMSKYRGIIFDDKE